jgi:predicted lysophospholipase L1 biosynthesis ABC-type transport system permease subunit
VQSAGGQLSIESVIAMRKALGSRPVHLIPVVETTVVPFSTTPIKEIGATPTWRLVGMDLVGLLNLSTAHLGASAQENPRANAVVANPPSTNTSGEARPAVFLSNAMAKRLDVRVGDALRVVIHDDVVSLHIGGLILPRADVQ